MNIHVEEKLCPDLSNSLNARARARGTRSVGRIRADLRVSTLEQSSDIVNNAIVRHIPVFTELEKGMSASIVHSVLVVEADHHAPHLMKEEIPRDLFSKVRVGHGSKIAARWRRRDPGFYCSDRDRLAVFRAHRSVIN